MGKGLVRKSKIAFDFNRSVPSYPHVNSTGSIVNRHAILMQISTGKVSRRLKKSFGNRAPFHSAYERVNLIFRVMNFDN